MTTENTSADAALTPLPCSVPRELLEALLDNTYQLRDERNWWKDEPRCNYQRDHQRYCDEIEQSEKILKASQVQIICAKCGLREEQGNRNEADF
jgi:hypothetical protein